MLLIVRGISKNLPLSPQPLSLLQKEKGGQSFRDALKMIELT